MHRMVFDESARVMCTIDEEVSAGQELLLSYGEEFGSIHNKVQISRDSARQAWLKVHPTDSE